MTIFDNRHLQVKGTQVSSNRLPHLSPNGDYSFEKSCLETLFQHNFNQTWQNVKEIHVCSNEDPCT